MESPFAPRRRQPGEEPAPKNRFQHELESKMREMRSRGKSVGLSESEDELGSDDELMAHFNMTNKGHPSTNSSGSSRSPWSQPGSKKQASPYDNTDTRRSPYYNNDRQSPFTKRSTNAQSPTDVIFGKRGRDEADDGMRTMKDGGWKPPTAASRTSPSAPKYRSGRFGSEDEEDESDEIESVSRQRNLSTSAKRGVRPDDNKENKYGTTSPSNRRQKTPTFRDSLDDTDDRPQPTPRRRSSQVGREPEATYRSGTPKDNIDERKTPPTTRRKSLFDVMDNSRPEAKPKDKKRTKLLSDSEDEDDTRSSFKPVPKGRDTLRNERERKSPYSEQTRDRTARKSPYGHSDRRTPSHELDLDDRDKRDQRRSPYGKKSSDDRKSPLDRTNRDTSDRRTFGSAERKSPYGRRKSDDEDDDRRGPSHRRGKTDYGDSPERGRYGRQSPRDDYRKTPDRGIRGRKSPWEEDNESPERTGVKGRRNSRVPDGDVSRPSDRRSPWKESDRELSRGRYQDDDRKGEKQKFRDSSNDSNSRSIPRLGSHAGERDEDYRYSRSRDDRDIDRFTHGHEGKDRRYEDDRYDNGGGRSKSVKDRRYEDERYDDGGRRQRDDQDNRYRDERRGRYSDEDDGPSHRRIDDSDDERFHNKKNQQQKDEELKRQHPKAAPANERESSVCGDVEQDPTIRPQQTKEGKELEKKQPKHQRKEKRQMDDAIDTIKDAQFQTANTGDSKMRYIDPAKDSTEKATRPQSSYSPRKPKPRYARPESAKSLVSCNSTLNIRDSVYQQWHADRMESARQEKINKAKRQQEEEQRKIKEKQEKLLNAKASYNTWLERKKEKLIEEKRKKIYAEAKKEKQEKESKREKQKDAEMTFRRWKEDKDLILKEKARAQKKEEEQKLKEKQEAVFEKKKDAEKLFKGWKALKDEELVEKAIEKQREEKRKKRLEEKLKREREQEAINSYQQWMENKEEQILLETRQRRYRDEDDNWKPAWKPNNSTVPFGR